MYVYIYIYIYIYIYTYKFEGYSHWKKMVEKLPMLTNVIIKLSACIGVFIRCPGWQVLVLSYPNYQ